MPVSDTVAYHVAFEIDIHRVSGTVLLFVVILDLVSQVWNIDATIRLTRDVQIIVKELGELSVPFLKEFHVVKRAASIGMMAIITRTGGISNTSWLLDIKHTCLFVPGILILLKGRVLGVH